MTYDIKKVIATSRQIDTEFTFQRNLLEDLLQQKDRTIVGLVGPRGSGKTVLLKQLLARLENSIYIPLDSLESQSDLFELIKSLNESYGYSNFLLDEIHFNQSANRSLKLSYDQLNVKIFFTSSIALAMHESAYDLSRRVLLINVPGFSFREYLELYKQIKLSVLDFEELFKIDLSAYNQTEDLFVNYLSGGCLPLSHDTDNWQQAELNISKKIINDDLPRVAKVNFEQLQELEKLMKYLMIHCSSEHNPSSLSKATSIKRHRISHYLELLEKSFLIKQIWPKGKNVLREPKILLKLPLRLINSTYEEAIGALREDFAVECFKNAGLNYHYLKTVRGEKTPDFLVEYKNKKYLIEIGGSSKSNKQFKGIGNDYEKFIFKDGGPYGGNSLPLLSLGGLY